MRKLSSIHVFYQFRVWNHKTHPNTSFCEMMITLALLTYMLSYSKCDLFSPVNWRLIILDPVTGNEDDYSHYDVLRNMSMPVITKTNEILVVNKTHISLINPELRSLMMTLLPVSYPYGVHRYVWGSLLHHITLYIWLVAMALIQFYLNALFKPHECLSFLIINYFNNTLEDSITSAVPDHEESTK